MIFVIWGTESHEVFAFRIHFPKGPRGQTALKANSQNPNLESSVSGSTTEELGVRVDGETDHKAEAGRSRLVVLWDKLKTKCKWSYPKWM